MTVKGYTTEENSRLNNFAVEPKMYVDNSSRTGFTEYAEKLNGRLAMIGFTSLLAMEVITKHGLLDWFSTL